MAAGSTARKPVGNQIAYLRRTVNFNSVATDTISRYKLGTIPAGSQILQCMVAVKTAFSAAGTRVLTVGSNGTTANNIVLTVTEETASTVFPTIGTRLSFTADTDVFIKLTTAGTAAAAGISETVLAFIPPEESQL